MKKVPVTEKICLVVQALYDSASDGAQTSCKLHLDQMKVLKEN